MRSPSASCGSDRAARGLRHGEITFSGGRRQPSEVLAKLLVMRVSNFIAGLLLVALFSGSFGMYAYILRRSGRQLPALLAGSALLVVLIGLVASLLRL